MNPAVSVIMPVLNGERYIGEAIESICRQTFSDFELIVVDDGSTDHTREIVHRFAARTHLKYVHHELNKGITRSVNDGLRQAAGTFIAFLDHDDLWLPEFLETQVTYLQEHPDVGMVHSDFQTIDTAGHIIEHSVATQRKRTRPSGHVFRELFMQSMICGNTVVVRRACFDRLGLWDERLKWADYHMWLRVAREYKIAYIDRVLTAYRQHSTQCTRREATIAADESPVAVQAIERLLEDHPEIRAELGERMVRRRLASFYYDLACDSWSKGETRQARSSMRGALRLWPTNLRYLALYAATLLGGRQARIAR